MSVLGTSTKYSIIIKGVLKTYILIIIRMRVVIYPQILRKYYIYEVNGWGRFLQYFILFTHQPTESVIKSTSSSSSVTCHTPRVLSVMNSCSCSVIVPIESVKAISIFSTIKEGIMRTSLRGVGCQVCNRMKQKMRSS